MDVVFPAWHGFAARENPNWLGTPMKKSKNPDPMNQPPLYFPCFYAFIGQLTIRITKRFSQTTTSTYPRTVPSLPKKINNQGHRTIITHVTNTHNYLKILYEPTEHKPDKTSTLKHATYITRNASNKLVSWDKSPYKKHRNRHKLLQMKLKPNCQINQHLKSIHKKSSEQFV